MAPRLRPDTTHPSNRESPLAGRKLKPDGFERATCRKGRTLACLRAPNATAARDFHAAALAWISQT